MGVVAVEGWRLGYAAVEPSNAHHIPYYGQQPAFMMIFTHQVIYHISTPALRSSHHHLCYHRSLRRAAALTFTVPDDQIHGRYHW